MSDVLIALDSDDEIEIYSVKLLRSVFIYPSTYNFYDFYLLSLSSKLRSAKLCIPILRFISKYLYFCISVISIEI